jgi:hypothetical protein
MLGKKRWNAKSIFYPPFFYHRASFEDQKAWSGMALLTFAECGVWCGYIELPRLRRTGRPSWQRIERLTLRRISFNLAGIAPSVRWT